jgi:hypothetical protein
MRLFDKFEADAEELLRYSEINRGLVHELLESEYCSLAESKLTM